MVFERNVEDFEADADIKKPHAYHSFGKSLNGEYTVVLPEVPPASILDVRLNPTISVPIDSYLIREELAYKYGGTVPAGNSLTPQEYYALISEIHDIPLWDF